MGDLSVGGGVYIYIPAAPAGYWPVTGVTEPQHYWPFSETGDYTDQGSTGGLDLTAQGSGNSFNSGLVLNGSGYAQNSDYSADLLDLGSTFSILFEGHVDNFDDLRTSIGCGDGGTTGYRIAYWGNNQLLLREYAVADATATTLGLSPGVNYQVVITHSSNNTYFYFNSVAHGSNPFSQGNPIANTNINFLVGSWDTSNYPWIGTLKRIGILKGEAWSADDVAAIYAALP